jgi:hypothetical protein
MKPIKQFIHENLKPSFSDLLLSLMREKRMNPPMIYKRAMMDRKPFSKIISLKDCKPSKRIVCAIALALELDAKTSKQLI